MSEHKTWKSFIDYETKKPYFKKIKDQLLSDNARGKITFLKRLIYAKCKK